MKTHKRKEHNKMKFRMFTDAVRKGKKIAVNVDRVRLI